MVVLVEQRSAKVEAIDRKGSLPLPLSLASEKQNLIGLKKGGPSELLTLRIGLKWWAPTRDKDARWLAAVKDIGMCMEELMVPGRKRKGGQLEGGAGKKKKLL